MRPEDSISRGIARCKLRDYRGAIDDFTKAIILDPKNAETYYNRGHAKRNFGDNQGAIEDYTKAIELDPEYAVAYNNRGATKGDLGDNQGAIEDFTKAIELDPEYAVAYSNRGHAKLDLGDNQGAVEDYTKAIELDPKNAVAYSDRGNAKSNLGDPLGAIEDYTKAIELDPKNAETYHNRAVAKIELKAGSDEQYDNIPAGPGAPPGGNGQAPPFRGPPPPAPRADNRRVRVFVSSTFRDMVEERDELMTHSWPELRRFCRERQVELVEVDLRWGISEAQSTRKETLKLCLDEIRACRPFFIGLLGERYGWVPDPEALTADLKEEQPWLRDLHGKSVTELEILHGVLNNPEMAGRSFFYFRDPAYAQGRGADFLPEDEQAASRQAALKDLIRTTCAAKGIPLREGYPDPRRMAALVLEDLKAVIDAQYPKVSIPDPLTREARDHEAFAESRRRTYIGRAEYFEAFNAFVVGRVPPRGGRGEPETPGQGTGPTSAGGSGGLVLLGDSGSGKSALLANWLALWRKNHPRDFIFQHYIGGTPHSADHWSLMTRLIGEIKRWTGDPEELPRTYNDILKSFPVWLAKLRIKAEREGVCAILVLDALNQLEDLDHARLLGWLPSHPFTGPLRLVVSTLPGDTLEAVEKRGWESLRVEPLAPDERRRMIAEYLGHFGKKLDAPRLERLAAAPAAANPLYLKILLDELRVTGTHERLDERLADYLAAPDIPALLKKMLARYEHDYERDRKGLVGEALGLISASRRGLTEAELLGLLKPPDLPQLPPAVWAPLRAALEESLVDRGGILNFAHEFLRTAVSSAFAPDAEAVQKLRLRLADHFEAQPASARSCDELPWLLRQAEARDRLRACLLDIEHFLGIQARDENELLSYWVWLGEERVMGKPYLASFERWSKTIEWTNNLNAYAANQLASFLYAAALYSEAETLFKHSLAIREKAFDPDHPYIAQALNNLAGLYQIQGKYTEAELLYKRSLAIAETTPTPNHPKTIATGLNNLAELYQYQGKYAEAEPLYKQSLAILEEALGPDHLDVATALHNLAGLYLSQEKHDEAKPLYIQSLAILEATLSLDHPLVATSLNNLAALYYEQGKCADAEPLYKRSLDIREKALGPDHPQVATSLNNLANLYRSQKNFADAEPLYKRSIAIDTKAYGPNNPEVATDLNNLATLYYEQGKYAAAATLYKRSLEIREKAFDPDHPYVAQALNNLARLYKKQRKYTEAEPLSRRHCEILLKFTRAADYPHPHLQAAVKDYARLLLKTEKSPTDAFQKIQTLGPEAVEILLKAIDKLRTESAW